VLAAHVVPLRMRHRVGIGDGGQPTLARAIRAHGNFIEHAPLLLLIAQLSRALPATGLHAAGAVIVIGRALHACGLSQTAGTARCRSLGTALGRTAIITLPLVLIHRGLVAGA
jgi:uncharacterized membrane protein YecN with MAPEG domain